MSDSSLRPAALWLRAASLGLLIVLSGCSATAQRRSPVTNLSHAQADYFFEAMVHGGFVGDVHNMLWLLVVHHDTSSGVAWVGEVRDEELKVQKLECRFTQNHEAPCIIRTVASQSYPHFTEPRARALADVFEMDACFLSGRDYWVSLSLSAYAGRGSSYSPTVSLRGYRETDHVAEWIRSVDAPLLQPEVDTVPIELSLPWMIARFYSAERITPPGAAEP